MNEDIVKINFIKPVKYRTRAVFHMDFMSVNRLEIITKYLESLGLETNTDFVIHPSTQQFDSVIHVIFHNPEAEVLVKLAS